jgi:hypothetical protein
MEEFPNPFHYFSFDFSHPEHVRLMRIDNPNTGQVRRSWVSHALGHRYEQRVQARGALVIAGSSDRLYRVPFTA